VLLLFLLLRNATGATGTSFLVAAIFALHPFNVETVAWISERKNVLSMLFFLATLGAYGWYAKEPKLTRFIFVVGGFVLALASKPMVVTLPFLLLLLDYWPLQRIAGWTERSSRFDAPQRSAPRLLLEKALLFALSAAGCVITLWAQESGGSVQSLASFSFGSRLGNALVSYVIYLEKTFWPSGFAVFYPHPGASLGLWKPCLASILLGAITAAVWHERVRRPYLGVGWLWFLGTMVPVIGIVQLGDQAMADHFAYLPLIGIFMIAVWGIRDLCDHFTVRKLPRALPAGIALAILSFLSFRQLHYWHDSMSLWSHAFEVTPENFTVEGQLAQVLIDKGDMEAAIRHLLEAAKLSPDGLWTHYYLGVAYMAEGRFQQAAAEFEATVMSSSNRNLTPVNRRFRATALLESGIAHLLLDEYPKALASFQSLSQFDPALMDQAIARYYRSLAAAPSQFDYVKLSSLLYANGQGAQGRAMLTDLLKLNPDYRRGRELLNYLNALSQPGGDRGPS
jgi:tetratricopeptide (TPR) repeat protein